jgi:hypothetical protein
MSTGDLQWLAEQMVDAQCLHLAKLSMQYAPNRIVNSLKLGVKFLL